MSDEASVGGDQGGGGDRSASLGVSREGVGRGRDESSEAAARSFAVEAARLLDDDKCTDTLVLDLRGLSEVTDFFVISSGTSERQMRAAGQHVDALGEAQGFALHRHNLKEPEPTWLVLDFVDVVVHVFEPQARLYYDLEMLWGDASRIDWRRNGAPGPAA